MEYILPHWKPPFDLSPAVTRLVQPLLGSVWMGWRGEGRAGQDWIGWGGQPLYGSFDHLIRPCEERRRNRETEGLGGLEVDHQLELGWLLHGQIARLGPLEDLVDIDGGASGLLEEVRYIGHQATLTSVVLVLEHRGEPELNRAVQDPPAVKEEERIIQGEERIGTLSCQGGQGSLELLNGFLYL